MIGLSVVNRLSNSRSVEPCGCSDAGCSLNRSTTLTKRSFRSGTRSRRIAAAASASIVATSPQRRQHDVRLLAGVGAGPRPDADALGAVDDRLVDGRELQVLLLVGDDDVDVVGAAQAVIGDRQQRVGVGRQVDAHDRRALVGDEIDEARDPGARSRCGPAARPSTTAGCSPTRPARATARGSCRCPATWRAG